MTLKTEYDEIIERIVRHRKNHSKACAAYYHRPNLIKKAVMMREYQLFGDAMFAKEQYEMDTEQ